MLRLLQCRGGKGTSDAKQGTGLTEALSSLDGLGLCSSSCRGVYKGIGSSYFSFQRPWQTMRGSCRKTFSPPVTSSRLYTEVQNILQAEQLKTKSVKVNISKHPCMLWHYYWLGNANITTKNVSKKYEAKLTKIAGQARTEITDAVTNILKSKKLNSDFVIKISIK